MRRNEIAPGIRHDVKVDVRQSQILAECSGVSNDSQHLPFRTMASQTTLAPIALSTSQIDFTDHSLADETAIVGRDHFSNKFMSGNS